MRTDDPSDTLKRPRVEVASRPAPPVVVSTLGAQWKPLARTLRARAERLPRWTPSVAALIIYLMIALGYFWWPIHSHFSSTAINYGIPDMGQNLWYLKWWPYAISHGLNPFVTYKMWHTFGYNLAWQTSLPGLSLLALPITATAGVVIAYNTWTILSLALTAWATYILCYRLTRQVWASLIGGYLFGFSGYMLAQGVGHIHLIVLFPIPLAIYLAILRYDGRLSRRLFLALTPLPLLLLFLVSVEEFALVAIFAYLALGLYFLLAVNQRRQALKLAIEATGAFLITGLVLAPYLYYMAIGYTQGEVHPIFVYSGDTLGFVIPTQLFLPLYKYFHAVPLSGGNLAERDSYLGLPLAVLMIVFAIRRWDKPIGKLLTLMGLISVAFTLGPDIFVAKVQTIPSPMRYVFRLPIIQKSLPIRFAMFVDLVGALMASLWLAQNVRRMTLKVVLGLALVVMLIPNLKPGVTFTPVSIPTFFSTSMYQQYIKPNDNVLILPLGFFRSDMLWQQAADFSFNLASGYGGFSPSPQNVSPVELLFTTYEVAPKIPQMRTAADANAYQYYLEQYVASVHLNSVVVQERYYAQCDPYLRLLHMIPLHVGGVWYYSVPSAFSHATLPGEQVAGEPISRPYKLAGAARWDEASHQLVVPAKTSGEALETLTDNFPAGTYNVTLTIHTASSAPVAYAETVINGRVTAEALTNGTTRLSLTVPPASRTAPNKVAIRIISLGGDTFTVGDSTMAKA